MERESWGGCASSTPTPDVNRPLKKLTISRVSQEDDNGCAIACVAMMLGITYVEAKAHFVKKQPDAGQRVVACFEVHEYLKYHGWNLVGGSTWRKNLLTGDYEHWVPDFIEGADVMWYSVSSAPDRAHAMLVLKDRTILDPCRSDGSLSHYGKVELAWGWQQPRREGCINEGHGS